MFQFSLWHRLLADRKSFSERMKHNIRLLHLKTDGQTAFIFHGHHRSDADLWKELFLLEIKGILRPQRRMTLLIISQLNGIYIRSEGEKKGPGGVCSIPTQKQKSKSQAHRHLAKAFSSRHTCSWIAAPYFALNTFPEELKSFSSFCPHGPRFKRNLPTMDKIITCQNPKNKSLSEHL